MVEHILPVAGSVFQLAEQFDKFGVHAVDAGVNHRTLTRLANGLLDLAAGFFIHFLNAGRGNTPVGNEFFNRQTRHLAAYRLKTGHGNGLGGVVDNQIHTCNGFQGTNISAFTADNSALHFVIGQRDHRNGRLGRVVCRATLNGG